ncbi:tetratricopeptide repeat protein [Scytonema sp. PRP1]|uniref:tetratricopeptide repeat protein n=1 Tax=Scytonema sp. PRP1 TaxID=3120513 RepID=UPI00300C00D4
MLRTFLQKIIQKITSTLGFTPAQEKDTEIAPTPDTQLDFLLQVLIATAESNGDAAVIHPLLAAHVDKLDISFAQVLRNWATGTLPDLETETAQSIAGVIVNFSTRMWDFPLGNRAENLEIAITGYEIALTVFTRERFPIDWAMTQNNLGLAYGDRIRGERAENLEVAIECYTQALQERTRDRFPIDWAMTQNNLGIAYSHRIRGSVPRI